MQGWYVGTLTLIRGLDFQQCGKLLHWAHLGYSWKLVALFQHKFESQLDTACTAVFQCMSQSMPHSLGLCARKASNRACAALLGPPPRASSGAGGLLYSHLATRLDSAVLVHGRIFDGFLVK